MGAKEKRLLREYQTIKYPNLCEEVSDQRHWQVSSNTKDGWMELSSLDASVEKGQWKPYLFEVFLPEMPAEDDSEIVNLQYFFVRTDRALRTKRKGGEEAVFILLVNVKSYEDTARVASYLYLQRKTRSIDMRFYTRQGRGNCIPVPEPDYIGRLPPMLRIIRSGGSDGENGLSLSGEYSEGELTLPLVAEEARMGQAELKYCCEAAQLLIEKKPKNKSEGEAAERSPLTSGEFDLFQSLCVYYLTRALANVRGVSGSRMSIEQKKQVIEDICLYITERLDCITPLGQYLWFLSLYFMSRTHELAKLSNDKFALRVDRLEKSFTDAAVYADGLLQLLENSCHHTENGVGYLSVRVHYVDRDAPDSELEKIAANRSRLTRRYFRPIPLKDEKDRYSIFPQKLKLGEGIPYYMEIFVCDDASRVGGSESGNGLFSCGIPYRYAENRDLPKDQKITLSDIFENPNGIQHASPDTVLENQIYHYGLPLLKKIVLRNRGFFSVSTPSMTPKYMEIYSAFEEEGVTDFEKSQVEKTADSSLRVQRDVGWQQVQREQELCRMTEYQILLPLSYSWQETEVVRRIQPTRLPLRLVPLKNGDLYYAMSAIHLRQICAGIFNSPDRAAPRGDLPQEGRALSVQAQKAAAVDQIFSFLQEKLEAIDWYRDHKICVLDLTGLRGIEIELSAKALFRYIGKQPNHTEDGRSKEMLFAVYLENLLHIQEFIRDFSVFYDERGENEFMRGVQIAICSWNLNLNLPEVNFLLAGIRLTAARNTAEIFAYYNAESTLPLLPQLRYLSRDRAGMDSFDAKEAEEPFPFDLYLRDDPRAKEKIESRGDPEEDVVPAPANSCWFLQRMARLIHQELREPSLGCKINKVHVRLGSKMHIEDFFEAELLFQNISVVSRFAYLIAQVVLESSPTMKKKLLLVGYENYSMVLLEYAAQFLRECGFTAFYGLYGFDGSGMGTFYPSPAAETALSEDCQVVTICPIGTTLGTIYQMADSTARYFRQQGLITGQELRPMANICILVVADKNRSEHLSPFYWKQAGEREGMRNPGLKEQSVLTIEKDRESRTPFEVRYFLMARTIWHDAKECTEKPPLREDALAYVDVTSTVPNMIFPLSGRRNDNAVSFADSDSVNDKRMLRLRGHISYGHIRSGNNHFLYDLDLAGYFYDVAEDVTSWLQTQNACVNAQAFNMVVSPLDRDNAGFLKAVIDHVFAHSIRVVRIPFLEARREDIRARFSFITEEYRRIKELNPKAEVNIYYVSNSIVTGEMVSRARKLVQMLLMDSGTDTSDTKLFKGIFLLVNRSSRSTIQSLVEDPDNQFHAYLHLSVPHYNTYKGFCPACARLQRNGTVARRCATNVCRHSFERIADKHKIRSRGEQRIWYLRQLWQSPESFGKLCQWLYLHKSSIDRLPEKDAVQDLYKWCLGRMKDGAVPENLEQCRAELQSAGLAEAVEQLWFDRILQDKACLRLFSTHWAYCSLESQDICGAQLSSQEVLARKYISELFQKTRNQDPGVHTEWVISYLKVISREYLSKHYYIRQAIFQVLVETLRFLLGERAEDEEARLLHDNLRPCLAATPLQQYQLLLTVLWQLSSMQANIIMRDNTLERIDYWFQNLTDQQRAADDPDIILCPLPTEEQLELDYIRCVKWGALSGDEENKCFLLQREQSIWEEGKRK